MAIPGLTRPDADTLRLYVILPTNSKPSGSTLCVEVSSRDGRYEARYEYPLVDRRTGLDSLTFPTRHRRQIKPLKADELAILAHVSATCDGEPGTFVVAAWEPTTTPDTVTVFLNSRVPTYVIAVEKGTVKHEARCGDLPKPTTAFNLRCLVPFAWITPTAEFYVRKRERRGTRTAIVDTRLTIRN